MPNEGASVRAGKACFQRPVEGKIKQQCGNMRALMALHLYPDLQMNFRGLSFQIGWITYKHPVRYIIDFVGTYTNLTKVITFCYRI